MPLTVNRLAALLRSGGNKCKSFRTLVANLTPQDMQAPAILFPSHPLNAFREVDPDFQEEYEAAKLAGFDTFFYDDDTLRYDDARSALRKTVNNMFEPARPVILRGYMLDFGTYSKFYEELLTIGFKLVNGPWEYNKAHYWNDGYQHFRNQAVESHFWYGKDLTHEDAVARCKSGAWYMKDYVKSAKEKGFIQNIQDKQEFMKVKADLLEARGKQFYDGICLKKVHEFKKDWQGKPFEIRLFYYRGKLITAHPTHGTAPNDTKPFKSDLLPAQMQGIASSFGSNFFSLDVGMLSDGSYIILECGDGGVSGLSPTQKPIWFYTSLMDRVKQADFKDRTGLRMDFADLYPAPLNLEDHRK